MKIIKKFFIALLFGISLGFMACGEKRAEAEKETASELGSSEEKASPMRTGEGRINNKEVKIQYGSPSVRNRVIWGDLLPYDEVWRTGANEATFADFSEDMTVEGEVLKAGKYSLFTIPKKDGPWTVIFNKEWDLQHGHFQYKEEHDVLRVDVMPRWEDNAQESLSISIENPGLVIKWEKLSLPIGIQ